MHLADLAAREPGAVAMTADEFQAMAARLGVLAQLSIPGCDYAWPPHPSPLSSIPAAGIRFVMRYDSNDPDKDLGAGELATLLDLGLLVGLVRETTAGRMRYGYPAGKDDAAAFDQRCKQRSLPGLPGYFACDYDAPPGDQDFLNAYLDGAASVIGRDRTGMYGGWYPLTRARAAGKATWFWGTIAWSGHQWDPAVNPDYWTPHILQGLGRTVGGASVDVDAAFLADYGCWPRPAPPPKPADWQVTMMDRLPVLHKGDTHHPHAVGRAQGLLNHELRHAGRKLIAEDERFGLETEIAVNFVKARHGLVQDGVIGGHTWAVLVTGAP